MEAVRQFAISFTKPFALPVLWCRRKFRDMVITNSGSSTPDTPEVAQSYASLYRYLDIGSALHSGVTSKASAIFFRRDL